VPLPPTTFAGTVDPERGLVGAHYDWPGAGSSTSLPNGLIHSDDLYCSLFFRLPVVIQPGRSSLGKAVIYYRDGHSLRGAELPLVSLVHRRALNV
jgi:hypothetical protein